MAQRLLRAFEPFAWVGFGKGYTQVLARGFPGRLVYCFYEVWIVDVCVASECFEMADQADEVLVGNGRFEAEVVFDGDGEGLDEVQGGSIQLVYQLYSIKRE